MIALPKCLTNRVIKNYHDEKMTKAHLGIHKIFNNISNNNQLLSLVINVQKHKKNISFPVRNVNKKNLLDGRRWERSKQIK